MITGPRPSRTLLSLFITPGFAIVLAAVDRLLPAILLFAAGAELCAQGGPRVSVPTVPPPNPYEYKKIQYPWKKNITATIFWIGEKPSGRNRTPNHKSSWDQEWQENYGGYDNPDPEARSG